MTILARSDAKDTRAPILAAIGFLLLVCLPIRFWFGPVQMTGLRLFLALSAPVLVLLWMRDPALRRDPSTWVFASATLWAALAISRTSPGFLIENTGSLFLETFCAYLLGRLCIRTEHALSTCAVFAAILLTLSFPLTIYEANTGIPLIVAAIRSLPLVTSVEIISIDPRMGFERAQSVFAHPIHFGLFAVSGVTLLAAGLREHLHLSLRLIFASVLIASTFLSLSSGPLLALAVQLGLLFWVWAWGASLRSCLALLMILALAYIAVDLASDRTPIRVFMSYATFSPHNAFWRGLIFEWGILNVIANPIFGLGFNDWIRPGFMISGSIDNYWLVLAMRYGLPGFLLFFAGFLFAIRAAIKAEETLSPVRIAWLITILSLMVALSTVHVWTAIHAFLFFLLGAGQFKSENEFKKPKPEIPRPGFTRTPKTPIYARAEVPL